MARVGALCLGVALCSAGCAGAAEGWEHSDERSCGELARVCVQSDPDRGGTYTVGGETLLPGECARPDAAGRTWVRVESHPPDASDDAKIFRRTRWASPRKVLVVRRRARDTGRDRVEVDSLACPAGAAVTVPAADGSR